MLHCERVRVVEAESMQQLYAVGRQRLVQGARIRCGVEFQDRLRDRTGVFDVDIDVTMSQRVVADQRPAQTELSLDFVPGPLEHLRDYLAEQIALVETLARDDDPFRVPCLDTPRYEREDGQHPPHASRSKRSESTYSLAGFRKTVSTSPLC